MDVKPYHWNAILSPDEILQKEFSISKRYRQIIVGVVVIIGIVVCLQTFYAGIFVFVIGGLYYWYLTTAKHYAFTNRRIVLVESFFGETVTSIDYNQITDIEIVQNALDQIFGWGAILLNTAGTHVPEIRLYPIDNPNGIKQALDSIRDKK